MRGASPPLPLLITRWAKRSARLPPALAPGATRLDPRDFDTRLIDAVGKARDIALPSSDWGKPGGRDGNWGDVLLSDPAILLIEIARFDVEGPRAAVRALSRHLCDPEGTERSATLAALLDTVLLILLTVDRWFHAADHLHPGGGRTMALKLVEEASTSIGQAFRALLVLLAEWRHGEIIDHGLIGWIGRLHHRWRLVEIDLVEIRYHHDQAHAERIADAVAAMLAAVERLVRRAGSAAPELLARNDHQPHITMLLTFLKLSGHLQDQINRLPEAVARYYHQRVIGAVGAAPIADQVHLAMLPAPAVPGQPAPHPVVPHGFVFHAAGDGGAPPPRFAADTDLVVTGARLREVRIWSGAKDGCTVVRSVPNEDGLLQTAQAAARPWQGLIIAGASLQAEAGRRRFLVRIGLSGIAWPHDRPPAALGAALRAWLSFDLRTQVGWTAIADAKLWWFAAKARDDGGAAVGALVLAFTRAADAPPLSASAAIRLVAKPRDPASEAPGTTGIDVATLLVNARIDGVAVRIRATGIQARGAAAPGTTPFGPIAATGQALRIGHPAFDRGGVMRIRLRIQWAAPPPYPDGFLGYYRNYRIGLDRRVREPDAPLFDNGTFLARFSAPLGSQPRVESIDGPLFAVDASGALQDMSVFALRAPKRAAQAAAPADGAPAPSPAEAGASGMALVLTAPDYAFGDILYPANVAYAAYLSNAAAARAAAPPRPKTLLEMLKAIGAALGRWFHKPAEPLEAADAAAAPATSMPNVPWRPVIAAATFDYTAEFRIGGNGDLVLSHWTSLDGEQAAGGPSGSAARMLPPLPDAPCIEWSFDGIDPALPLALFLQIERPAGGPIAWQVPGRNGIWTAVAPGTIADDTCGLTRSGLVRLASGVRGLRALVSDGLPVLVAVLTDVVSATRILAGGEDPGKPVAAGSIVVADGIRGVAAVRQPMASFGGRSGEHPATISARIGERLRHKGRGVLAWDHERLILDRFPDVAAVRVLPARDTAGPSAAGQLLALVVGEQRPDGSGRAAIAAPRREAIRAMLAAHASLFATIIVVDPEPVRFDIHCAVALRGDDAARLEADIRTFFAPGGPDGPDLPDDAQERDLARALVHFIRGRRYVADVGDVGVALAEGAPRVGSGCGVPEPARVEIAVLGEAAFAG